MKKILYILTSFITLFISNNVFGSDSDAIKNGLIGNTSSNIGGTSGTTTSSILGGLFTWAKTEIFSLVMVLAIGVFVFIGIRFASARGNPEEFKKAWMQLIYAILGIFFIFMAWGLVKIVASLSL